MAQFQNLSAHPFQIWHFYAQWILWWLIIGANTAEGHTIFALKCRMSWTQKMVNQH